MLRARYRRIVFFFARLILSLAFWELLLPKVGLRGWSARTRADRLRRAAIHYRTLAIQMGGVLIKVGQFLSSRVDVLPPEFTNELKNLQDEVPAEKFADIRRVVETEFGVPLDQRFAYFEAEPLAAASLGQVHQAGLSPLGRPEQAASGSAVPPSAAGTTPKHASTNSPVPVVVKVLRPNIEQVIDTDLAALRTVGAWLNRYPPIRKRADVPALLVEFTRILLEEVDYLAEGRNAETFAANFKDYPGVRVPKVYWSHTTRRTLTLENVLAIKITDYTGITQAGIPRGEVAGRLLDTYLKQIFEDGFFHADPHPGNLFVQPLDSPGPNGETWVLTFVDFGMVGRVPENLRSGLREMVIGVGTQDAKRVVQAYQMMDLLLPGADLEMIERAEARVFERYWGKNMTELSSVSYQEMRELTEEFRELVYNLPFQVPQNVIFLARCVGILSGMCTGLEPQFNLWEHLAPYARKLTAEEARAGREVWLGELEKLARALLVVPTKLDTILSKMERGDVAVRAPEVVHEVQRLEFAMNRLTGAVIFSGLLLGGIQVYLSGTPVVGEILLVGAGLSFLRLLLKKR
jgi:predicted unusual protein kinase regulating ubiquinone biosynthesis (AarF/ABC1/UbiB family)